MDLSVAVKQHAQELGFDLVAIAPVGPSPEWPRYRAWLDAEYAGEMDYLWQHSALKQDPRQLMPQARSFILVGLNYAQNIYQSLLEDPARGRISLYALGRDYHKIMRKALIKLDQWLTSQSGSSVQGRVFVDSAPILERSWASRAGLGFIGKNTCLINPHRGSWFFLGGLLTSVELKPDPTPQIHPPSASTPDFEWHFADGARGTCGACTRCMNVCPTRALTASRQLDARQCISYLTIEHRGPIPLPLRPQLQNWVFGCDLCQIVCPWNRHARPASHFQLQPHPDRIAPPLLDLLALDEDAFLARFAGSPVMRAKWEGFMRNVCVATGNWGDPAALPALERHLWHSSLLIAEHAAWALARLRGGAGLAALERALARSHDHALQKISKDALVQASQH